ncbi:MAG: N-terminal phage integrase SAM-like domain-containing protein [Cetobacterium sp.]|nr:N-terminal phage integrase SAM-like domain-containing protein [Cetobacterium sp.]
MTFKSLYELYMDDQRHRLREHTIQNKTYLIETKILPRVYISLCK